MFLIEYIKKYKVTYISVVITFIIGICLGIFVTFKMPENEKNNVKDYLHTTIKIFQEKRIDKRALFKERIAENFKDIRNNMAFRLYNNSKFYNLYLYDI